MDATVDQTVAIARAEAERMRAVIAGAEQGASVRMSADQFAGLSQLITLLCDQLSAAPGTLGDPKYWVPLDMFQRARRVSLHMHAECERLRQHGAGEFTLSPAAITGA